MYDYEKAKEIAERAMLEFDPDAHSPLVLAMRHRPLAREASASSSCSGRATASATTSPSSTSTAST